MPDLSVMIPGEDALKQVFTNIPTGESISCLTLCQEPNNWYYHIKKKKFSVSEIGKPEAKASSVSENDCKICFLRKILYCLIQNYVYMLRKPLGKLLRLEHNLFKGL